MSQLILAVIENDDNGDFSKEQHVVNYLKSMLAIEEAMEPYKEQKKELRTEYVDEGWLTKDEIWAAVKAFRLYMKAADMDDLNDMFEIVEKQFGPKDNS